MCLDNQRCKLDFLFCSSVAKLTHINFLSDDPFLPVLHVQYSVHIVYSTFSFSHS